MIAFATIFLGLMLGVQEVEVTVGEGVATVELVLNGRSVGILAAEPWKIKCDFGDELAPQELVAIARDEQGREIERARQWLNMPQPPARVTIAIDQGSDDKPAFARLSWESRAGAEPRSFQISFDGVLLATEDPRVVELPPHDSRQLHFLRAELEFSDNVASVAEVTFGGTYTDQVSAELTAVPVTAKGGWLKKKGALEGLLMKKDQPLQVVAVERGTSQVVVVPDEGVLAALDTLTRFRYSGNPSLPERALKLRDFARFSSRQFMRVLWPAVQRQQGTRQSFDLFPTTARFDNDEGGLYFLLYHMFQERPTGVQRLADAVAVAGLHAAGERQGRTVILLLSGSGEAEDPSQLLPRQARTYLRHLRVPFHVWSFAGEAVTGKTVASETAGDGWGERVDVSSMPKFERATERLSRELGQQWLVWLEGIHLPQEVSLANGATRLELVE